MSVSKPSVLFWLCLFVVASVALLRPHPGAALPYAGAALSSGADKAGTLQHVAGGDVPMPVNVPAAHASTLVALGNAHPASLAAFWFAGTRESAADVQIALSTFDRKDRRWTAARFVVDRHLLGQELGHGVRRLGNPVAWLDADERLHLFVVATGLGGWAAARIVHLIQQGDPYDLTHLHFAAQGVLPLSWLWNTSHLVRNAPLPLRDGGMMLPIYFEIGSKYAAVARFSGNGEFIGLQRISTRRNLLQPTLLALTQDHWLSYMRMSGGMQRIAAAETHNAGRSWQDLPDLALPNPNAAVAAIRVHDTLLLAYNPASTSRAQLTLAQSDNGRDWSPLFELEHGQPTDEFSYPAFAWTNDSLWVSYTHRREKISWQQFSFGRQ